VRVEQTVEQPLGPLRAGAEQRGGRGRCELRSGMETEQPVRALLVDGQLLVGEVQGGGHAPLARLELGEHVRACLQAFDQVCDRPRRAGTQPGGGDADGEREPPAQLDDLGQVRGRFVAHPGLTGGAGEQGDGVGAGEHVEGEGVAVVQPGEQASARDEHEATGRSREQRLHLLLGGRVVEQDQGLVIGEPAAVQRRAVLGFGRDLLSGYAEGAQHAIERFAGLDRTPTLAVSVQVEVDLLVRVAGRHAVGRLHGEGRLADARHAGDRDDHQAVRVADPVQVGEFGLPAGEEGRRPRELAQPVRSGLAVRGHEQRALLAAQPECVGEQPDRRALRWAAAFEPADGAHGEACPRGELLLRHQGALAPLPQQLPGVRPYLRRIGSAHPVVGPCPPHPAPSPG
jgi:hypothetical protein